MGDEAFTNVIKISDYLEQKYFAEYAWVYERTKNISVFSETSVNNQEDCHQYQIII